MGSKQLAALVSIALLALSAGCGGREVERYGMVIGLREDRRAEYEKLHSAVPEEVLEKVRECNIRNYSIYLAEIEKGKSYLFSYFEYVGDDFEGDMARMASFPAIKEWWSLTDPCQEPIPLRAEGEWWAAMREVFHTE